MSKNDGGSAFPVIETMPRDIGAGGNYTTIGDTYSHGGMSLRDYFAAKAMQGLILNDAPAAAKLSYQIADALLAERAKDQP